MTGIHDIKNKDYSANKTHILQNTGQQNVSVWTTGNVSTKQTIKTLITKHKNVSSDESTNHSNAEVITSLEVERAQHENKAYLRTNLFKQILVDEQIELSTLNFFLFILGTILVCSASTFIYTLIPLHNVIIYPSYWYEILFISTSWSIWAGFSITYYCGWYLNLSYISGVRHSLVICVTMSVIAILCTIAMYVIWTCALGFGFPLPWWGYIVGNLAYWPTLSILWFRFPIEWRKNVTFRRRFKWFLVIALYRQVINFQYNLVSTLLIRYQNVYQPLLAVLLAVIRAVNSWIYGKCIGKTASGDDSGAQLAGSCYIGIAHAVMLCYVVGSSATLATYFLLVGIDFAINMYLTVKIIWVRKRKPDDIQKQSDLLQELAHNELVEFIVPLVFLIAIVVGFYGPNCNLIGNVGATIWQYSGIQNINETIMTIIALFLADFFSSITSSMILWFFCKINFLKALMALEKECRGVICLILCSSVVTVSA